MSALDTEPANGGGDIPALGTQQKVFYRWQVWGQRKFRSHTPSEMQSALHIRRFGTVFVLGANWQSVAVYYFVSNQLEETLAERGGFEPPIELLTL